MVAKEKMCLETGAKVRKFEGQSASIKSLNVALDSAGKVMQALDASISACKAWLKSMA